LEFISTYSRSIGALDRPHRMLQRLGAQKIAAEGKMFLSETWESGAPTPCGQWKHAEVHFPLWFLLFWFPLQILH